VVNGGFERDATSKSSKPTMLRSSGTRRPASRAAHITPMAMTSLMARTGRRPQLVLPDAAERGDAAVERCRPGNNALVCKLDSANSNA